MSQWLSSVDPDGLLEYSVVYTDRSLNHMSAAFQGVMKSISTTLKSVYKAEAVVVVPGSGTFAMEAVARQFANDEHCLVIRNGWFSYRWTQIFAAGNLPKSHTTMMAKQQRDETQSPFAPAPIEHVVAKIIEEKPAVVFAPHVETSAGIILPDDYVKAVAQAVHQVGGLLVLDCIASGALWVDMQALGVDVLISAPQKGWSGSPCCGLVMLNQTALEVMQTRHSNSFACDLRQWFEVMRAYEQGAYAYHTTMPTDSLASFDRVMQETQQHGFDKVQAAQQQLGDKIHTLLNSKGIKSVAADGFQAPGVMVCYTDDVGLQNGSKFAAQGMQIAAGMPLQCQERDDFQTFRIGLFGLDKLYHVDASVARLAQVLDALLDD